MSDQSGPLERELLAMRPRAASRQLLQAVSEEIGRPHPSRGADRCLVGAMGAGVLAACVIVAVLAMQASEARISAAPVANVDRANRDSTIMSLARANSQWDRGWK